MDFATWVQSQIDKFGITIYQISKRSGVHASTIANWLNGAKPQDAKAKAVKTAVEDIIEEKQALSSGSLPPEGTKKAPATEGEGISCYETELMRLWRCLSPEQQARELAFLREEALKSGAEKDS